MKKLIKLNFISCIILSCLISTTFISCSFDNDNKINDLSDNVSTGINVGEHYISKDDDNKINDLMDTLPTRIDTDEYTIIEEDGNYYIVFTNELKLNSYGESQMATVDFETIQDFKNKVTKGLLTDAEKATIATAFRKNENRIFSCNFNELYEPVLPSGGEVEGVAWKGENYSFTIEFDNNVFGFVHYYTPEQYNHMFEYQYENLFNKDTITITRTEQIGDGQKIAIYYETFAGKLMNIRYTLQRGTKTIMVDKTFRLAMSNGALETSSSVPSMIVLYCIDGEEYYGIDLHNFSEDPSDEWLMQFGMTQYVEKNLSVK